jgi:hypothetical protein
LSGKSNHQYPLWTILMFQAWLERQSASRDETTEGVRAAATHA